jgi:hypothetical protein
MPGPAHRKGAAVSLVQDQDVELVDANNSDLTITVTGHAENDGVKHITDVLVSNTVCRTSRYLRPIIDVSDDPTEITLGGELKRSGSNKYGQDEGENREGLLVVLAHLHGLSEQRTDDLGLYNITVLGVWYAITYTERDQSGSAKSMLQQWFGKWYATSMEDIELNIDSARGLAFPCQLLDHALGFARVTKWLAYNHIGAVKERPPKGFRSSSGLHLPPGEFVGKFASSFCPPTKHQLINLQVPSIMPVAASRRRYISRSIGHAVTCSVMVPISAAAGTQLWGNTFTP